MRRLISILNKFFPYCVQHEFYAINTRKKEMKMRVKTVFLFLVLLSLSFFLFSQNPEELISQADNLYIEMKDMETAQEALAMYRTALQEAENKYGAYWKMSRIHYYIGSHTEGKKEKQTIFSQGIYYAKKAIVLEPEKPAAYYWLGVNYGVYGEARGVMKSLFLVDDIKEAMNKVIELDRSYEDGGPDRVLGRVYFKVPGIAGGSKKKSLEHLLKSIEFGPEDPLTRVYLADTYLALKEVEKARAELDYVLGLEDDPRWVAGMKDTKEEARELLKNKKFREKK
jgi:tetratricopeptide (TPR) repeat protein